MTKLTPADIKTTHTQLFAYIPAGLLALTCLLLRIRSVERSARSQLRTGSSGLHNACFRPSWFFPSAFLYYHGQSSDAPATSSGAIVSSLRVSPARSFFSFVHTCPVSECDHVSPLRRITVEWINRRSHFGVLPMILQDLSKAPRKSAGSSYMNWTLTGDF